MLRVTSILLTRLTGSFSGDLGRIPTWHWVGFMRGRFDSPERSVMNATANGMCKSLGCIIGYMATGGYTWRHGGQPYTAKSDFVV